MMTKDEVQKALALQKCIFLPGSFQKRFARDIGGIAKNNPDRELTTKQSAYLLALFHSYRRQIPKEHNALCECKDAEKARKAEEMFSKEWERMTELEAELD